MIQFTCNPILCFSILLFLFSLSSAQKTNQGVGSTAADSTGIAKNRFIEDNSAERVPWEFRYGLWQGDFSKLNESLSSTGTPPIIQQVKTAGITFATHLNVNRTISFNFKLDFDYFLPQDVQLTPSIRVTQTGYGWGMAFGRDLFPKSKYVDVVASFGFNAGTVKLIWTAPAYAQKDLFYRNPFFAPKVVVQPFVMLGRISFGLRAAYQYDISRGNWTHKDKSLSDLGNSYMTGFILEGVIGFKVRKS
jgi:hypothetical protein